jgi:hypothetical protein
MVRPVAADVPESELFHSPPAEWGDLQTNGHSLQLYETDEILIDGLARFAGAALGAGDPIVVIATREHRHALEALLIANGLDVHGAAQAGRYVALDAAQTLSHFMVHGHPDRSLFMPIVGGIIARAAEAASETGRYVAAFGEMVALLWASGEQQAALELEGLWNELAESYAFYLHCAYPSALFVGAGDVEPLAEICARHSQIIGGGPNAASQSTYSDDRFQAIRVAREQARALGEQLRELTRDG